MNDRHPTPQALAEELVGRRFEELDAEEQEVLKRIASGELIGLDAEEEAALHRSFGDRLADQVANWGGSWAFIIAFGVVLVVWVALNTFLLAGFGLKPFDEYPFIFLNLVLSMLAAVQAPVIMMSQNRQGAKDRVTARHDYEVNLRTQLEIVRLHRKFDQVTHILAHIESRVGVRKGE